MRTCKVKGCKGKHYGRGYCHRHFKQEYDKEWWAGLPARKRKKRLEQMRAYRKAQYQAEKDGKAKSNSK